MVGEWYMRRKLANKGLLAVARYRCPSSRTSLIEAVRAGSVTCSAPRTAGYVGFAALNLSGV
jgi:hypothetical protein